MEPLVELPLTLIAAVARNGVIGSDNALPWRLPSDLRHFKASTWGRPVLMGRKTYLSIGGPLPGREIVVVTRDVGFAAAGVTVAHSIAEAVAAGQSLGRRCGAPDVMVAGGGTLYAALIGQARRLLITEVDLAPAGDTLFPVIDLSVWRETNRTAPVPLPTDAAAFTFVTYERA